MFYLIIISIFLVLTISVLLLKWRYCYWTRQGVTQLNYRYFYGNLQDMFCGKLSLGEVFEDIFLQFKDRNLRFGGIYFSMRPSFVPVDPALIKDIMVKDFEYFEDRGSYFHKNDPLTNNLFRMAGEPWRTLRQKLSPTFTSSRMKMMFETVLEKMLLLEEVMQTSVGEINVSELAACFTSDVIGSCAFGIECDALRDPNCEFRTVCKKINQPRPLKQWAEINVPREILGLTGFKSFPHVEGFFRDVVSKTIKFREENNVYRKDFMHLLLQLRNRGALSEDGSFVQRGSEQGILTDDEILSQCFLFFAAGFDTSGATISFALYELAKHVEVQERVREELKMVLDKYQGVLTYEAVKELTYMDQIVSETLRIYPIVPSIPRICTKRYKIKGTNVILERGTSIQIPVRGLHMDPEYYPDPKSFNPERFTEDEIAKRSSFTYLPFGDGPRICIGARFARVQVKLCLAGVLKNNRVCMSSATPREITFKPNMILLHPSKCIYLNIKKA